MFYELKKIMGFAGPYDGLSHSDYLLISYPKSGNTFVRFVVANIINLEFHQGKMIDFYALGKILPEVGKDDLSVRWPYDGFPRVVKTHECFSADYLKTDHYIYVTRDPRDICISYYHYMNARKDGGHVGSLSDFIRNKSLGLSALNEHVRSWLPHNPYVLRYEDLMQGSFSTVRKMFDVLGISVSDETLQEAVSRSLPDRMREMELKGGRPTDNEFKDGFLFVRDASVGQWSGVYNEADLDYFRENAADEFGSLGYLF